MAKTDRFQVLHKEGNGLTLAARKVLVDTCTGVQYLFIQEGYSGGLCPLLDQDGKPLLAQPYVTARRG